jgi:hypothetical protein
MKRPSMYDQHERSLKRFADLFNGVRDGLPLVMQTYHTENYRDDGIIVNTRSGKRIAFDWEYRDRYFESGKFPFQRVGQFERKLKKDEIGLSLQCDRDETAVVVAWHTDLLREKPVKRGLATDSEREEQGTVRFTEHFRIYHYSDLKTLRRMLHCALQTETFDHTVF